MLPHYILIKYFMYPLLFIHHFPFYHPLSVSTRSQKLTWKLKENYLSLTTGQKFYLESLSWWYFSLFYSKSQIFALKNLAILNTLWKVTGYLYTGYWIILIPTQDIILSFYHRLWNHQLLTMKPDKLTWSDFSKQRLVLNLTCLEITRR